MQKPEEIIRYLFEEPSLSGGSRVLSLGLDRLMACLKSRSYIKALVCQEKNPSLMIYPRDLAPLHMYKVSPKTLQSRILTKALSSETQNFPLKYFWRKNQT
jgi:hypothetical protein